MRSMVEGHRPESLTPKAHATRHLPLHQLRWSRWRFAPSASPPKGEE